jgi:PTH1 family peptidyl-tRNA hydrolase
MAGKDRREEEGWKLLLGLGNPGDRYRNSRHNAGFMALAHLALENSLDNPRHFGKSLVSKGRLGSQKVILAWPQTYMNLSGQAAIEIMSFYRLEAKDLLVIHDEMDLPLGRLKLTKGGGDAGHNGLKSLMSEISGEFDRLRLGIGRPPKSSFMGADSKEYVLAPFSSLEEPIIDQALLKAAKWAGIWALEGLAAAQREANRRKEKKPCEAKETTENGKDRAAEVPEGK